jgi:hypothetical protein
MKKPKYLTSRQLKIAPWERKRLIQAIDVLKSDKIVHAPDRWAVEKLPTRGFNMQLTAKAYDCGTICCIGGLVGLLEGKTIKKADKYVDQHHPSVVAENRQTRKPISHLYYPPDEDTFTSWDKITPAQAAKATDNFLRTGKPKWEKVLA